MPSRLNLYIVGCVSEIAPIDLRPLGKHIFGLKLRSLRGMRLQVICRPVIRSLNVRIQLMQLCSLCEETENVEHILFNCALSRFLWSCM